MIPRWVGALVKGFDRLVYISSRHARSQGVGLPTLVLNKRAYQGQAMMASSPITEVLSQIDSLRVGPVSGSRQIPYKSILTSSAPRYRSSGS